MEDLRGWFFFAGGDAPPRESVFRRGFCEGGGLAVWGSGDGGSKPPIVEISTEAGSALFFLLSSPSGSESESKIVFLRFFWPESPGFPRDSP